MTEIDEPPYDGPPRSWKTTNAQPVSGSTVTVRAEYVDGGGVYLSAAHEDGRPDEVWLSRADWKSLYRWYLGAFNFERATRRVGAVCYPGVSGMTTCGVRRVQLGDEWRPRVGAPSEVTCAHCRELLDEVG